MTPEQFEAAAKPMQERRSLVCQLNDWETSEKPTRYFCGEIPQQAWDVFRRACKEHLQRRIDEIDRKLREI
jgi:hypothetical protein